MALQIGGPGADRLEGGPGDDELRGEGGNDLLFGEAGDDLLIGGPGDNLFEGAAGDDVIDNTDGANGSILFSSAESGVIADLRAGRVEDDGQGGADIIRNIVNVRSGSRFDDVFTGTDESNFLSGSIGDDELFGLGGRDFLIGGRGDDRMFGGDETDRFDSSERGNNFIDGGAAFDIVDYSAIFRQSVFVDLKAGEAVKHENGDRDTLVSIEGVVGSDQDDVLIGSSARERLIGGGGDDRISGGAGDDVMRGGAGDDIITVDDAGDIVIDRSVDPDTDRINTFVDFVSPEGADLLVGKFADKGLKLIGNRHNDSVTGSNLHDDGDRIDGFRGNDRLVGLAGDDFINGGAGNDRMFGNSGDDILRGGGGNDVLAGQSGADRFIHRPGDGADRVVDFDLAQDVLDLSAHSITDFAEFRGLLSNVNGGVQVSLDGGGAVLLSGVRAAQLQEDDVILVA